MKDYLTAIFTSFDITSSDDELGRNSALEQSRKLEQLSDDEFWSYARQLARSVPPAATPEEYLTCILSRENSWQCLIPLGALFEIVRSPHRIAPLPAMPAWMRGVGAWRGETIAVVDLNAYLAGSTMENPHEGTLLIANYADLPLGLLVSACGAVIAAQSEDSLHPPDVSTGAIAAGSSWCLPGRAACIKGAQAQALVVDVGVLLGHVVREIGSAAFNG